MPFPDHPGLLRAGHRAAEVAVFEKPIRSADVIADVIARAVVGERWSGTPLELFAAIEATATDREREARDWPRSTIALAACLRLQTDGLRGHGLRMSIMPDALLIERLRARPGYDPPMPGRA